MTKSRHRPTQQVKWWVIQGIRVHGYPSNTTPELMLDDSIHDKSISELCNLCNYYSRTGD